jgi:hypothetical protein
MVEVNVDFMIEAMKCHKDDKHDVKGLDTEVNKHTIWILNLYSLWDFAFVPV